MYKSQMLTAMFFCLISCTKPIHDPEPVFDFTKLKGKNIKELNTIIGQPYTSSTFPKGSKLAIEDHYQYNYYRKGDTELLVNFNPHTLKIRSYMVRGFKPYTKRGILRLVNLDVNNLDGFILSDKLPKVPKFNEDEYSTITIIPLYN